VLSIIIIALILLYSIILHELAHGQAAELMGDPTARLAGRLTLNPLPHLDPLGTLLPLLLMVTGAPLVFGWAKPVPINPYNFRDREKGMLLVSSAGIVTNLFIAWLLGLVLRFLPVSNEYLAQALLYGIRINVVLAVFNLIPIPPLDGSRLFAAILPYRFQEYLDRLEQYGLIVLFMLLLFPPTEMLLSFVIDLVCRVLAPGFF